MKPEVLVVGAGPVGLTMAAELARYGVGVRIVEKAAERTNKTKALNVWSRTLELIDRMGCGASSRRLSRSTPSISSPTEGGSRISAWTASRHRTLTRSRCRKATPSV